MISGISAEKRTTAEYPCLDSLMAPLPDAGCYPIKLLVAGHAAGLGSTRRAVACCSSHKGRWTFHLSEGMGCFSGDGKGIDIMSPPPGCLGQLGDDPASRIDVTTHNTLDCAYFI